MSSTVAIFEFNDREETEKVLHKIKDSIKSRAIYMQGLDKIEITDDCSNEDIQEAIKICRREGGNEK